MIRRDAVSFIATALATAAVHAPARAANAAGGPTLEPLVRHADWLAVRPTASALAGKVVLVDVFTFGCYNCRNVTPNLRKLYRDDRDAGLAIVGIHTPETPYESVRANVATSLADQGIVWPVAIDDAHELWNAYGIEYWPTQMIFDRRGTLRKTIVGDSQDALVDATVAKLLAER